MNGNPTFSLQKCSGFFETSFISKIFGCIPKVKKWGILFLYFIKGFWDIYIHYIHWEPGYLWSGKTTLNIFKAYLIFKQSLFKSEMVCVQCTIALFHLHLTIKYHQLSLKTSSYSRVFTVNLQSVLCEYFGWMLEHEANGYCIL